MLDWRSEETNPVNPADPSMDYMPGLTSQNNVECLGSVSWFVAAVRVYEQ